MALEALLYQHRPDLFLKHLDRRRIHRLGGVRNGSRLCLGERDVAD
jgi:hypothetical protein